MLFQSLEYLLLLIVALLFIRFSKNALVNKIVIADTAVYCRHIAGLRICASPAEKAQQKLVYCVAVCDVSSFNCIQICAVFPD